MFGNRVRRQIEADKVALGFRVHHLRGAQLPLMAHAAGFDFVFIDLEHSVASLEQVSDMCLAALGMDITPLVRCPKDALDEGVRALDNGAMGIIVPHINTGAEAETVVAAFRYPPIGDRSWGGPSPLYGYRSPKPDVAQAELNDAVLVIVMVETPEAIDNIDEIVAVPGIDMIMIGTSDLSATLGVAGQSGHPLVRAAYAKVAAACKRHNVWFGMGGVRGDPQINVDYIRLGIRFIMAGSDQEYFMAGATARVEELRAIDTGVPGDN